ncbi:retention module-containing protein, partial [Vreelandella sulfidaeris]
MATATIVSITGQAWARDEAGNLRELGIGDVLQEGEVLITSSNGSVELDFSDDTGISLVEGGQEVAVTPDLVSDLIIATDASAQDDDLEALLAALDDEDGDLLDLLDATAAGGVGAGGGGGGSDFVRLARIAEETDSLSFETSGGLEEAELIDFGGAPDAEAAAEVDTTVPTVSVSLEAATGDIYSADEISNGVNATITLGAGTEVGDTLVVTDGKGNVLLNRPITQADLDNGVSVTVTDINAGDTALSVTATVTDPAGNSDTATDNGVIDATAPAVSVALEDASGDIYSADEISNGVNATVTLGAGTAVGDTLVVTDG